MVVPCLFIARLRRDLSLAQERQLLQSWHFRRLGDQLMQPSSGSPACGSSRMRAS